MTSCPSNSFQFNETLCACDPGFLLNITANQCTLFRLSTADLVVDSGVDYSISFPISLFSFDSIKKFTQSQAVFLEATAVMLLSWLLFCFFVRFGKVGDGDTMWFRIRWWISRLDISFATRHWLEDQKVVMKRKTELGGTFSIASWILFIGLLAALLYQIISQRNVEMHNVRATNGPDLVSFFNDLEFNITTISSMSCSNLRGLGTLVTGSPGFLDQRIVPLTSFADYTCHNSTKGPTITITCKHCQLVQDNIYISWQFVDIPNRPATAVGFQFNLTARNHADRKHLSFVSGTVKNGSNLDDTPVTFRGVDANILKFNLFPRVYRNLHDLKLIQPLFHDFLPGSFYNETSQLEASLENFNDGMINTTLYINFLSDYIIEIDTQNIVGLVGFLADLGGLYCISIGIFFYLLVQCEFRVKRLRHEDSALRSIRNRRKAREHWDKLRKYVMYTWGCSTMENNYNDGIKDSSCTCVNMKPFCGKGQAPHKQRQQYQMEPLNFNRKVSSPCKKSTDLVRPHIEGRLSYSRGEPVLKHVVLGAAADGKQHTDCCTEGDASQLQAFSSRHDNTLPLPPLLEFKAGSEIDMSEIQKNLQELYDYNIMLRDKFLISQTMLHDLATKASTSIPDNQT